MGPSTTTPPSRAWPQRYSIVALCFSGTFICYIDRVNPSIAIIPMQQEFGWSLATQGVVLSAFFWGYLATQILGGWLADRHGGKVVLGIAVLLWSLFTLLTPPAAASLGLLLAVRVGIHTGLVVAGDMGTEEQPERLAIVGESKWEAGMAVFCKPFTAARIQYFDLAKLDDAKSWIESE